MSDVLTVGDAGLRLQECGSIREGHCVAIAPSGEIIHDGPIGEGDAPAGAALILLCREDYDYFVDYLFGKERRQ